MRGTSTSAFLIGALLMASLAGAQDLVRESIPEKWIEAYLPEDLPKLELPAYAGKFDKARAEVFSGRYKTALLTLNEIKDDAKIDARELAVIKARALSAVGLRDEAIAALSLDAISDAPAVQLERARILAEMGKLPEAIALLKAHLEKMPDSLRGHFLLGAVNELAGDVQAARDAYEWIHKGFYDKWRGGGVKAFDDAETVVLLGRAFDRHATLTGAYANNAPLHNVMLKVFTQAYDLIDRTYWPAHVAAAEYFFSHGDARQAAGELEKALEANPNDARSLVLLGLILLEQWNFDGCDAQILALRRVDDTSIDADLLEARSLLQQRSPKNAQRSAERILERQPNHLEALGLLAAAQAIQLEEEKVAQTLARVERLDPDNASAYFELGNALGGMRQYPRAATAYQKSIERAPWWTEPRNGLGLLYTQSGDEDKAKETLEAAAQLDPFNYRTINYLRLLDRMAKLERRESEHFVILFDPQQDPIIADYFLEYMEQVHEQITSTFKHEPAVKTLIEVFPTHEQFSVRTTGSPWIGTVGASTGRVIAMVSPRRGSKTLGTYNWAQVLRHEYTHTVTLSATDNRIGHWMTEGLAVYEEHIPVRWEWVPMLYNAVKKKELFSMEDLTWAFVRPKKPHHRSLAYAQSYWICKYIEEKWGHDHLLRMMAEFKKGKSQEDVFPAVLNVSLESFSEEFFAWTEKQVESWGYDKETSDKYKELVEKAEEMMKTRDYAEAAKAWQAIISIRPVDQLPHLRLAGLFLTKGETYNPEKAAEHLIRLHQVSLKDNRYAKRVARLFLATNDLKQAEKYATESVFVDPYDLDAHQLLADISEKTNNTAALEREKKFIPILEKLQEEYRRGTVIEGPLVPIQERP